MLHRQEAASLLSGCNKVFEWIEISKNIEHPGQGYSFSMRLGKMKEHVEEKGVNM